MGMVAMQFHLKVTNMSDIKYFNVKLNLNDGIAEGVYPKPNNEQFNYKENSYDVCDRLRRFLNEHNPVSKLTENNIDDSYIKSYFDCVRTDELYEALYKYAEVYEDLYNGYCNDTARGGKTGIWNNNSPIPVPVLTSPVNETKSGGTCANDDAEIFIKIRGIPIPMRKYKLSDNTLIWKFPEYAFGFIDAIECMSNVAIPTNTISDASYYSETFKTDAATPPNYAQHDSDGNLTEIKLGALNVVREY